VKIPRILLLYKKSSYSTYFLGRKRISSELKNLLHSDDVERFKETHQHHYASLLAIEGVLKHAGLPYSRCCRGTKVDYARFDLVITVGGDGTFLEAARNIRRQVILGVNSDPRWSVGRFCAATVDNFAVLLNALLSGKAVIKDFQRMRVGFSGNVKPFDALNDILICHRNPAAMSRYYLSVGAYKEEQRSSGVWVATAAGSTGAICSAGGKALPFESSKIQYKPRELYQVDRKYRLEGGVVDPAKTHLKVVSMMREGVVYGDGSHVSVPFSFGRRLHISLSPCPLKVVWA